jgi:hypothetical protein
MEAFPPLAALGMDCPALLELVGSTGAGDHHGSY